MKSVDDFDDLKFPNFSNFLNNPLFSDVTLQCKDAEIPSHRLILSTSIVFRTMLTTDMAEKKVFFIFEDFYEGFLLLFGFIHGFCPCIVMVDGYRSAG